LHPQ